MLFDGNQKKLDLWSLYVPFYRITQLRVPVAMIITPGKEIVIRKLPKRREYFIDKDLGMFQIKPEFHFTMGKTAVYIYDMRNQNPIDPGLLNELWKWANAQFIYKIRRVDVQQAIELRQKTPEGLKEERERQRKEMRVFMNSVLSKVKEKNDRVDKLKESEAGLESDSEEYKKISPSDQNFIIIQNMFDQGYIDANQAAVLNHELTTRKIVSTDQLLKKLESFCDVFVSKPLPVECERILDDYHTYKPQDIISYLKDILKIGKGLKGLRTKPVINWFPATYLLFGALGIGIVIVLYLTYGQHTDTSIIPGK